MPDLALFFIYSLAVWRVARMIGVERGPFDLFWKWKMFIGKKFLPVGNRAHWIDEGFNCPKCLGFWVSFATAWAVSPKDFIVYALIALASSALTVIYQAVFN